MNGRLGINIPNTGKRRQVWYLLDSEASQKHGRLAISFHVRERRRNGQYGRLKVLRVDEQELPHIPDGNDRELWVYDGTRATQIDLNPGGSSDPYGIVEL